MIFPVTVTAPCCVLSEVTGYSSTAVIAPNKHYSSQPDSVEPPSLPLPGGVLSFPSVHGSDVAGEVVQVTNFPSVHS